MEQRSDAEENRIVHLIDNIPIFCGIGLHEQHMVARRCHFRHVDADEIIIEQDDVSDFLYVIIKGSVAVSKKTASQGWVRVAVLSDGDLFGEIAILRNIRRTARVTTLTPCTLLTLSSADFLDIYQSFPRQSRDNIQLVVAKRLAQLSGY